MHILGRVEKAYLHFYHAARQYSIHNARPGGLDGIKRVEHSMRGVIPSKTTIMIPKGEEKKREKDLSRSAVPAPAEEESHATSQKHDVQRRLKELQVLNADKYPRIKYASDAMSCRTFRSQYYILQNGEDHHDTVTLRGRVYSIRKHGSRLIFIDLVQDGEKVQVVLASGSIKPSGVVLTETYRTLKRGDIISISGTPRRQAKGELSLQATSLPTLLSPALASLPTTLNDPATLVKNRHADLLIHQNAFETLRLRSHIIQALRQYLLGQQFQEVQTPILARSAGGAVARPFTTFSTEFSGKSLSLRIAPELWLKRLVIGGIDRVFEIGPVFRNEGIDGTHNPEFYTCEFYEAFASLDDLIRKTEDLVAHLVKTVNILSTQNLNTIPRVAMDECFTGQWKRLEFIPTIEQALGRKLPDLSCPTAYGELMTIFEEEKLAVPTTPTLPRLLDRLCGECIEPQTIQSPTFITHHPAVLAPLAKAFLCPITNQLVSARAELFINGKEIANMYEEENDPAEQRRKFVEQRRFIDGAEGEVTGEVDEDYLQAMEWGLPPTGGWGMGLERLVMFLSGRDRIGDVCSFGTLRSVVGLGKI